MIDHAAVREQLELAALEPAGLDRLAAGDTPEAAAVAGHLAGCPACAEEARRLTILAPRLREVAQEMPPDGLRERTLALVRDTGRSRGTAALEPVPAAVAEPAPAAPPSSVPTAAGPVPLARQRRIAWWPVAIAAVMAVLLIGGGLFTVRLAQDLESQAEALADLNTATLDITGEADATRVVLASTASSGTSGTLLFSAGTSELVVSAPGLTAPAAGQELACWVTRPDGTRARMGRMEFGGGLAYWAGWSDELKTAGPGTTFGVTLVGADGKPVAPDVLVGTVGQS